MMLKNEMELEVYVSSIAHKVLLNDTNGYGTKKNE